MFPISTVLNSRFKLEHIPHGEHNNFVMETLLNMLGSVHIIEALSSMPIDDLLASTTHKCSKVMIQFMQQSSRSTTVDEKSVKVELEDYLCEPCICCLRNEFL